jgi:trans-aconitate methyltransferase
MIHKPTQFAPEYAEPFQDVSVVAAYRYRPPYPDAVFSILAGLITGTPRRVLDVGCGTGNIARNLVGFVEHLDAVDFSQPMITYGRQLPNGDHPALRWLCGRVEDIALDPPYALVTAGESLHWMDWNIVLPRFCEVLLPGSYLALVGHETTPDPWSSLHEIIPHYRTDAGYQPYNMLEMLERHGLFHKVGEQRTAPSHFVQTIDDYIESYHSRSGFSRERMGQEQAAAFDQAARRILLVAYPDGLITLEVMGSVVWGFPGKDN